MNRAAIYCRVSTEDEVQINALEKQIEEAKLSVSSNGWTLVDEYIDEGKSGTMTKTRKEYNRLFQDLEVDKFDIVVIKSQDRLMRSTKDWYLFVDKLVQNHKKLFFYLDNKFYSTDDALITGIKAILAEEYSRDLSKKINNAHYHRQQSKGNVLITSKTWGYDKKDKKVVVNEEEAKIVRKMFELCADGYGTRSISKSLANEGIFSRTGAPFIHSTIGRIIRNPLYKGTVIMNKLHYDFNSKQIIHNDKNDWVYKENAVPPIVDDEIWEKANKQMDNNLRKNFNDECPKRCGVKKGNYPLSSKIVCGYCGSTFWRRYYKRTSGEYVVTWSCSNYVVSGRKTTKSYRENQTKIKSKNGGCDNIILNNDNLENILKEVANNLYQDKDNLLLKTISILTEVLEDKDDKQINSLKSSLESITSKREKLLDKYLDGVIMEDVYKNKDKDLLEQAKRIENDINLELLKKENYESIDLRISKMEKEIKSIVSEELALNFIYRHLKNITVYLDKLIVAYDIFPPTIIKVNKLNYRKTVFSVCEHS